MKEFENAREEGFVILKVVRQASWRRSPEHTTELGAHSAATGGRGQSGSPGWEGNDGSGRPDHESLEGRCRDYGFALSSVAHCCPLSRLSDLDAWWLLAARKRHRQNEWDIARKFPDMTHAVVCYHSLEDDFDSSCTGLKNNMHENGLQIG